MSHASGEIWSESGKRLGFFEYNGTSDVVCPRVHLTIDGVRENWRSDNWRDCKCDGFGQAVVLYTDYGFGFYWGGRVCWNCMAITGELSGLTITEGHPFFNERMVADYGRVLPCPRCAKEGLVAHGGKAPITCRECGAGWYEWELAPKELTA